MALVMHAMAVRRDRGQWTTDPGWHRVSGWSLTAAPAWFAVGVAIASGQIMSLGAVPSSWSVELIAAPLVLGWLIQVLIGSWTHLVPSIGPGDQPTHARQRVLLGRGSTARLALLNGGVALLVLGLFADALPVMVIGGLAALGSVAWALAMLLAAATATRIRPTELRHSLDKSALVR